MSQNRAEQLNKLKRTKKYSKASDNSWDESDYTWDESDLESNTHFKKRKLNEDEEKQYVEIMEKEDREERLALNKKNRQAIGTSVKDFVYLKNGNEVQEKDFDKLVTICNDPICKAALLLANRRASDRYYLNGNVIVTRGALPGLCLVFADDGAKVPDYKLEQLRHNNTHDLISAEAFQERSSNDCYKLGDRSVISKNEYKRRQSQYNNRNVINNNNNNVNNYPNIQMSQRQLTMPQPILKDNHTTVSKTPVFSDINRFFFLDETELDMNILDDIKGPFDGNEMLESLMRLSNQHYNVNPLHVDHSIFKPQQVVSTSQSNAVTIEHGEGFINKVLKF